MGDVKNPAVVATVILAAAVASAADLRSIEGKRSVELTTKGRQSGKPRRVTIWFVHDKGRIYLQSGKDGKTHWYRNLLKTPEVTLNFGALVVSGRATPVEDPNEVVRVHGLFRSKYVLSRVVSWFGGNFGRGKVVLVEVGDSQ